MTTNCYMTTQYIATRDKYYICLHINFRCYMLEIEEALYNLINEDIVEVNEDELDSKSKI